jgi:hypothetical protein
LVVAVSAQVIASVTHVLGTKHIVLPLLLDDVEDPLELELELELELDPAPPPPAAPAPPSA